MPTYKIKYSYRTDNTFRSYDEEGILDCIWTSLEIVKENLQRIRDHYLFYNAQESAYIQDEKNRVLIEEAPSKPWFNKEDSFTLFLKQDNGDKLLIHAPWCGYFETLYEAEIIEELVDDDGMKISFM